MKIIRLAGQLADDISIIDKIAVVFAHAMMIHFCGVRILVCQLFDVQCIKIDVAL